MNRIFGTPEFDKQVKKLLDTKGLEELYKFFEILKLNSKIGKPLGFSFFREKKIRDKRVYFLVYDDICIILFVGVSNKKNQKYTINKIKIYFDKYKEIVYELNI